MRLKKLSVIFPFKSLQLKEVYEVGPLFCVYISWSMRGQILVQTRNPTIIVALTKLIFTHFIITSAEVRILIT